MGAYRLLKAKARELIRPFVFEMDLSAVFALDTTTVCVSVFIVALGGLWMYVMFARPTSRASERLEELLSEEASKPEGAKVRAGKKGSRGKGKSRAVSFETFQKFRRF